MKSQTNPQPIVQIGISQTPISFCTNCDVLHMDSGDEDPHEGTS